MLGAGEVCGFVHPVHQHLVDRLHHVTELVCRKNLRENLVGEYVV